VIALGRDRVHLGAFAHALDLSNIVPQNFPKCWGQSSVGRPWRTGFEASEFRAIKFLRKNEGEENVRNLVSSPLSPAPK